MRTSRWWLASTAALPLAAWGCGGGPPSVSSSSAEAKVTGTVKVNGKAMSSGKVTLDPSNSARPDANPHSGDIKPDGSYEVITLVGRNTVRVAGPEITKNPSLAYSNETIDVPSAGMTHEIVLPPPRASR